MHKKPKAELLPLYTELGRTLRNLKKVRSTESTTNTSEHQDTHQNISTLEIERPQRQRTMEEFWRQVIRDEYFAMRQLAIDVNNFELKPTLITMVQQHQYTGHPNEDPNEHCFVFFVC